MSQLKIPTTEETIQANAYEPSMHFLNSIKGSQDTIESYEPPEPIHPRYGLVRPEGYRTLDAETLTLKPGSTERVACFIAAVVRPIVIPGQTDQESWLMWDVYGVQSINSAETVDGSVSLFIDSDVDQDHVKRLLIRHDTAAWFVRQLIAGNDSKTVTEELSDYFTDNYKQYEQAKPLVDTIDMMFERDHNLALDKAAKLRLQTAFLDTLDDGKLPEDSHNSKCHACMSSEPITLDSLIPKQ
jgi:hypothetical protein